MFCLAKFLLIMASWSNGHFVADVAPQMQGIWYLIYDQGLLYKLLVGFKACKNHPVFWIVLGWFFHNARLTSSGIFGQSCVQPLSQSEGGTIEVAHFCQLLGICSSHKRIDDSCEQLLHRFPPLDVDKTTLVFIAPHFFEVVLWNLLEKENKQIRS